MQLKAILLKKKRQFEKKPDSVNLNPSNLHLYMYVPFLYFVREILVNYINFGHRMQDVDLLSEMAEQLRGVVRLLEAR